MCCNGNYLIKVSLIILMHNVLFFTGKIAQTGGTEERHYFVYSFADWIVDKLCRIIMGTVYQKIKKTGE